MRRTFDDDLRDIMSDEESKNNRNDVDEDQPQYRNVGLNKKENKILVQDKEKRINNLDDLGLDDESQQIQKESDK